MKFPPEMVIPHLEAYRFAETQPYLVHSLETQADLPVWQPLLLKRPTIATEAYEQALDDLNSSWRVIKDKPTDKQFEIGVSNLAADPANGVDMEQSTFTSSLSGNSGNAVEDAEHTALHPDRQRLYVASFGNGLSSYWDTDERRYIKQTGRFTDPEGNPLPTIAALSRALYAADLIVTRLTTNSAGGAYATGLMAALQEGQVTHAYIKSRPNISNHRFHVAWGLGMMLGDMLDDRLYKRFSNDPWKMTDEMVVSAEKRMPNIYGEEGGGRAPTMLSTAKKVTGGKSFALTKLWTDMVALSRGGDCRNNPAAADTAIALQRHPEALLTYHFPLQDRLYGDVYGDAWNFLNQIEAQTEGESGVQALFVPGGHRDHTSYPGLRWAAENHAFRRSR